MKLPEMKIIYWITGISFVMQLLAYYWSEATHERIGYSLGAIILLIIFIGLWQRSDLVRKVAVYYYGFSLFMGIIFVFLVTPYVAIFTEQPIDVITLVVRLIIISANIFVIRAIVNEPLLSEFVSHNTLVSDTGEK